MTPTVPVADRIDYDKNIASPSPVKGPMIPLTAAVPPNWSVNTFTRFLGTFEAFEYSGWVDESISWKTDCYIGDWSPLLKLRIRGPEALSFVEYLSTNSWPNFKPGQAKHSIMCLENGVITGEGLIMMLDKDDFLYTSGPGVAWVMYQSKFGAKKFNASVELVTEDWYLFQVQGPKSVMLMDEIVDGTVLDLKFMSSKQLSIDGSKFHCLRQGVSGELGFELWGPAADGPKVYDAICKMGQKYGIRELGGRSKSVNHVEAAFPTPGLDFVPAFQEDIPGTPSYRQFLRDSGLDMEKIFNRVSGSYGTDFKSHHRTPFDLGWGWLVKFEHDYIGKEALLKIAEAPPNKLVTVIWNSEDVTDVFASLFRKESYDYMEMPRVRSQVIAEDVLVDGRSIGCTISRCYSYWFKEMISLAIIETKHAAPGTNVTIKWGSDGKPQKLIRGVIKPAPYKEDKRKHPLH